MTSIYWLGDAHSSIAALPALELPIYIRWAVGVKGRLDVPMHARELNVPIDPVILFVVRVVMFNVNAGVELLWICILKTNVCCNICSSTLIISIQWCKRRSIERNQTQCQTIIMYNNSHPFEILTFEILTDEFIYCWRSLSVELMICCLTLLARWSQLLNT